MIQLESETAKGEESGQREGGFEWSGVSGPAKCDEGSQRGSRSRNGCAASVWQSLQPCAHHHARIASVRNGRVAEHHGLKEHQSDRIHIRSLHLPLHGTTAWHAAPTQDTHAHTPTHTRTPAPGFISRIPHQPNPKTREGVPNLHHPRHRLLRSHRGSVSPSSSCFQTCWKYEPLKQLAGVDTIRY